MPEVILALVNGLIYKDDLEDDKILEEDELDMRKIGRHTYTLCLMLHVSKK
ncbi:PepSY domain-containing protein [Sesbania bispinosa]|nr:PepSY domain-containing protein [Sesbania bispinosa]